MNNNIWDLKQKENVCVIDIDGVLNNYPESWINFVNNKLDTEFSDLNEMKYVLSYQQYKDLKEEYRLSGIKENLEVKEGAVELTKSLKELGYTIIIVTARPANKYPSLYSQTLNWLKSNSITYDSIYFGEKDKHVRILLEIHNLKFMLDDNSYTANQVGKWGYKVFLISNIYNEGLKLHENVIRVNNLSEVLRNLE